MPPTHAPSLAEGKLDVHVQHRFYRASRADRVFVDVGAARPDFLSMSAYFRALGWKIIAIEPNPAFCALHEKAGHEVLHYACGDHDQDNVDFTVVDSHGASFAGAKVSFESFSSLAIKDSYAALKPDLDTTTIKINLRKLDTILQGHAPEVRAIDILSIDVEGWELEVLRGLDLDKYRPGCVILENLFDSKEYRQYMTDQGYVRWRAIPPNEVFVRRSLGVSLVERARLRCYDRLCGAVGFVAGAFRGRVNRLFHREG